jgi:hypothetical protein
MYCRASSGTSHGWNKVWNKKSRVESRSYSVLFQCSSVLTKKTWFGKVKIKMVRSFEAFCECKAKTHFSPSTLRTVRTLEQTLFAPLLLLLYYIYYIYKTRTYRTLFHRQKPCSSSIRKVKPLRTPEHDIYQILTEQKTGF